MQTILLETGFLLLGPSLIIITFKKYCNIMDNLQ